MKEFKTESLYGIDWGTEDLDRDGSICRLADDDASASGNGDGELAELLLAWLALTPSKFPKASRPLRYYFAMFVCM